MKFQERSYSSNLFRPKPIFHSDAATGLFVVAASWGLTEHAERAVEDIVKSMTAAREDVEVTSHFEVMSTLTKAANDLRIALLMTNDSLSRGENRSEYISGLEVLALVRAGRQLSWAQVGHPHILVARPNEPLMPLSMALDLVSTGGRSPAPLPARLLGVERFCQIQCGDCTIGENDRVVLLSSTRLPSALWTAGDDATMENLTDHMIQQNPDAPFWLGLLES